MTVTLAGLAREALFLDGECLRAIETTPLLTDPSPKIKERVQWLCTRRDAALAEIRVRAPRG